ncbi:MAG TPA: PQQ-dependent dehydrogenase, methanol/ethanol family [Steroidobacteraceae bacterium]|nr:PQQ-dependent dehydrogenase, methanol/ethanol family [Steroidobacteraceae bacterium]
MNDVMANDGRQRSTLWALTAATLTALALAGPPAFSQSSVSSPTPPAAEGAPNPKQLNPLPAAADIRTVAPLADGQWTVPAGDYANTRFSPLRQINATNVANLKVVSTMADGIPHGWEGQPLVVGDTMYVVTPYPDTLIAIDLKAPHGPVKWIYNPNPDPRSQGVACCDVVNRGAVFADGKIIYNLLDDETVAVDAKSGKQVWRTKLGSIRTGTTMTMAPLVVDDKVFVGNSGNELGTRGWITALNVSDGSIAWRAYSNGSDKDCLIGPDFKPYYAKDRGKDLGLTTWPPGQWKVGGGAVWGWISYDPETQLLFYGTGNPGTWDPTQRPGDNKWSNTLFARNPQTGQAVWAFQEDAHDAWDYDTTVENILIDMPWHGRMRKLLIHPGRMGFVQVFDRTNGQLLSAEKYVPVNWARSYSLQTGLPDEDPAYRPHLGATTSNICPSSTGGKDWNPTAFDPQTGLLYIQAHNVCMTDTPHKANYIAGTPYLGADVTMFPGPGGWEGAFIAWDVADARPVWTLQETKLPLFGGVLATGGNLVFYGTLDGWFRAVDARSGKVLWQFKTSSGIVGEPMTFLGPHGKQYIAVYSGIGGWLPAAALPSVSETDPTAALGTVGAVPDIKKYTSPGGVLYVFGF